MKAWYEQTGPHGETVLASFVTLSRNLAGVPYPVRLNLPQKDALAEKAFAVVQAANKPVTLTRLRSLYPYEAVSLAERLRISPAFAAAGEGAALITDDDAPLSVMLGDEDHIRIRATVPGLAPEDAFALADDYDDVLDLGLHFAFSSRLGYLNQDPMNIGTGMRAGVLLHLPALSKSGALPALASTAGKLGFSIKGAFGDGISVRGDLYSLENTVTMGISEAQALGNLKSLCLQISTRERRAAEAMLEDIAAQDRIHRAMALLTGAKLLTAAEATELISGVRMGALYGLLDADLTAVTSLFVSVQPATMNCAAGRKLPVPERDALRAQLVKRILTA